MWCSQVKEFTAACNDDLPTVPQLMTKRDILFCRKMVDDEMNELVIAKTIGEQADALVDAIYYMLDVANRMGVDLDPIFKIVHGCNMKKVGADGKVKRREDGKILKPEGFISPDSLIEKEITRQITGV